MAGVTSAAPFDIHNLLALQRVGGMNVNGEDVLYTLFRWNESTNVKTTGLHYINVEGTHEQVLFDQEGVSVGNPTFVDDEWVLFTKADDNKVQNLFSVSRKTGAVVSLSDFPVDIDNLRLSPDGRTLAFTAYVYPNTTIEETARIDAQKAKSHANARIFDRLFIRHWNTWETGKFRHIHVAQFNGPQAKVGPARDIMPAVDGHSPSEPFGGTEEFAFSPDSASIAYSVKSGRTQAWLVNDNVWLVAVDGQSEAKCLSCHNTGRDMVPQFSPDGKKIAWLSTTEDNNEAARNRIAVLDLATGSQHILTEEWDRTVNTLLWHPADADHIYVTTYEDGRTKLFSVSTETGWPEPVVSEGSVEAVGVSTTGNSSAKIVFQLSSYVTPSELYIVEPSGNGMRRLTAVNDDFIVPRDGSLARPNAFSLPDPIDWTFSGADGDSVQAWVFKPHGAVAGRKYPVALYCHGGPESPWSTSWSYRWNPQLIAAQGFAVLAINFHGSPGFSQKFTQSIQKDWGGKPFQDQILGVQEAVKTFDFMDGSNMVGMGASYGGYTMQWMQSHAPKGMFKTLVMHDGIFDLKAMYYATEELWFPEWEMGGSPTSNPASFAKWSPANYVDQWETPQLIIFGEQDFRIPYTEGIAAFTALQRKGIESKLILFPDECHWVQQPANSILWHDEVIAWIKKFTQQ